MWIKSLGLDSEALPHLTPNHSPLETDPFCSTQRHPEPQLAPGDTSASDLDGGSAPWAALEGPECSSFSQSLYFFIFWHSLCLFYLLIYIYFFFWWGGLLVHAIVLAIYLWMLDDVGSRNKFYRESQFDGTHKTPLICHQPLEGRSWNKYIDGIQ